MDLQVLDQLIRAECLVDPEKWLVVGVSGGPDSLSLMDVLNVLGYRIVVVHFDHRLRPESGEDAQMVSRVAEQRELVFVLGSSDVAALARDEKLSIEEAARTARYRFLFQTAREFQAQAVAVGHTADDQVETVLMHFLRGSGLSGLKGMTWRSILPVWDPAIPLVRPLLQIWREETEQYCIDRSLSPVFDRTNTDITFFRNRLRYDLLPRLRQYNPQVKEVIQRNALTLAGDYELLEGLIASTWAECLVDEGQGYILLRLPFVRSKPGGLQRWIVRQAVGLLRPGLRDIDFDTVLRAVDFIRQPGQSGQMDLAQHISIFCEDTDLWFLDRRKPLQKAEWPRIDQDEPVELTIPGSLRLSGDWVLEANYVEGNPLDRLPEIRSDPYQAIVDAKGLSLSLTVHKALPGERFEPLGMPGKRVKMSDFWVNEGLSRLARADWPLVSSYNRIIWVPGFRPAHAVRITSESELAVHLRLKRDPSFG
jgi:tRNA(Ile)-lysidine synthase